MRALVARLCCVACALEPAVGPKRSYMRRRGQATKAQKRARRELWGKYGIDLPTRGRGVLPIDTTRAFGRSAPLILDVGHGHGESTVALSRDFPRANVLGVEVHVPSIGATLLALERSGGPSNVRLVRGDVLDVLPRLEDPVAACFVGFPDPWPGSRLSSVARRLVRPELARLLGERLDPGASARLDGLAPLCVATDDGAYAAHARQTLAASRWTELYVTNRPESRPTWRPVSAYERKAREAGRVVWDLGFSPPPARPPADERGELLARRAPRRVVCGELSY